MNWLKVKPLAFLKITLIESLILSFLLPVGSYPTPAWSADPSQILKQDISEAAPTEKYCSSYSGADYELEKEQYRRDFDEFSNISVEMTPLKRGEYLGRLIDGVFWKLKCPLKSPGRHQGLDFYEEQLELLDSAYRRHHYDLLKSVIELSVLNGYLVRSAKEGEVIQPGHPRTQATRAAEEELRLSLNEIVDLALLKADISKIKESDVETVIENVLKEIREQQGSQEIPIQEDFADEKQSSPDRSNEEVKKFQAALLHIHGHQENFVEYYSKKMASHDKDLVVSVSHDQFNALKIMIQQKAHLLNLLADLAQRFHQRYQRMFGASLVDWGKESSVKGAVWGGNTGFALAILMIGFSALSKKIPRAGVGRLFQVLRWGAHGVAWVAPGALAYAGSQMAESQTQEKLAAQEIPRPPHERLQLGVDASDRFDPAEFAIQQEVLHVLVGFAALGPVFDLFALRTIKIAYKGVRTAIRTLKTLRTVVQGVRLGVAAGRALLVIGTAAALATGGIVLAVLGLAVTYAINELIFHFVDKAVEDHTRETVLSPFRAGLKEFLAAVETDDVGSRFVAIQKIMGASSDLREWIHRDLTPVMGEFQEKYSNLYTSYQKKIETNLYETLTAKTFQRQRNESWQGFRERVQASKEYVEQLHAALEKLPRDESFLKEVRDLAKTTENRLRGYYKKLGYKHDALSEQYFLLDRLNGVKFSDLDAFKATLTSRSSRAYIDDLKNGMLVCPQYCRENDAVCKKAVSENWLETEKQKQSQILCESQFKEYLARERDGIMSEIFREINKKDFNVREHPVYSFLIATKLIEKFGGVFHYESETVAASFENHLREMHLYQNLVEQFQ